MNTLEKRQFSLKVQMEILWWVLTALVSIVVIFPLLNNMYNYQFLIANVFFVIIFITYTRYIFLLKHTFLAYWQAAKFVLIFASIPLIFKQVEYIQNFQEFVDTEGLGSFEKHFRKDISYEMQQTLVNYLRREYLFFGVASVITAILLPFRMLISYWRVYNKTGTV